jgi:hypothetical protein
LAVAQTAAPQARHGVLDLVTVRIINVNMLGATNDSATIFCVITEVSKWVQVMLLIKLSQLIRF